MSSLWPGLTDRAARADGRTESAAPAPPAPVEVEVEVEVEEEPVTAAGPPLVTRGQFQRAYRAQLARRDELEVDLQAHLAKVFATQGAVVHLRLLAIRRQLAQTTVPLTASSFRVPTEAQLPVTMTGGSQLLNDMSDAMTAAIRHPVQPANPTVTQPVMRLRAEEVFMDGFDETLADELDDPLSADASEIGAALVGLGLFGTALALNAAARAHVDQTIGALSTTGRTALSEVQAVLADTYSAGDDYDTMVAGVDGVFQTLAGSRAAMMARQAVTGLLSGMGTIAARLAGLPTERMWNCVPGDARVAALGALQVGRRWHEGPVVLIKGRSGVLTVTPNHAVLTDRGWIRADEVVEGDHLVRYLGHEDVMDGSDPDEQDMPAQVGEVFGAAHERGPTTRVMRGAVDLDRDGPQSDVEVVPLDRQLVDRLKAPFLQPAEQLLLELSDFHLDALLRDSNGGFVRGGFGHAAQLLRGQGAALETSLGRLGRGSKEARGGLPAVGDPGVLQDVMYERRRDAELLGDVAGGPGFVEGEDLGGEVLSASAAGGSDLGVGLQDLLGPVDLPVDALLPQPVAHELSTETADGRADLVQGLSRVVSLDEVLDINVGTFTGHVFDLETIGHWYVAEGFIVHNSQHDDRVRGTNPKDEFDHVEADGQVVGLSEPFIVSGEPLDYPGDPNGSLGNVISCRCYVTMVEPDTGDQPDLGEGDLADAEGDIPPDDLAASAQTETFYREDQPRDDHGRWTGEGGGGSAPPGEPFVEKVGMPRPGSHEDELTKHANEIMRRNWNERHARNEKNAIQGHRTGENPHDEPLLSRVGLPRAGGVEDQLTRHAEEIMRRNYKEQQAAKENRAIEGHPVGQVEDFPGLHAAADLWPWLTVRRRTFAGNAGNADALIKWYDDGANGQIDWGSPGDFEQCVQIAGDHVDDPEAFCAQRHHDATGEWPGKKAHTAGQLWPFLTGPETFEFDESKHPRGQPDNKGEFVEGAGGEAADVKAARAEAKAHDVAVTADVTAIAAALGGKMAGLEFNKKSAKSYESKIARDLRDKNKAFAADDPRRLTRADVLAQIHDGLRYTTTFDGQNYVAGARGIIAGMQERGYELAKFKNNWATDEKCPGLNMQFRAPGDGYQFEYQVHTTSSREVEAGNHPIYDAVRDLPEGDSAAIAGSQLMTDRANLVPRPPGVENLTWEGKTKWP